MDNLIIKAKEPKADSSEDEESVKKASPLPSKLICEVIRREGEEELARSKLR